jgi:aspartyl-tRNA(Asn)/glutamyl-tRNA(Gln) amidotransferase subunit A
LTGIVGMKPTYGRVSRYGLVAFSSSLDQIGPFARDVTDCAQLLNVICGHDELDATSLDMPVPDFTRALSKDVGGLRIGVPKEFMGDGIEAGVRDTVQAALGVLEQAGASIEEASLPSTEYGVATYYIIAPCEASSNLARYDGVRFGYRTKSDAGHVDLVEQTREEGFGEEVKRRILIGTYALSAGYYDAYYLHAQKVRTKMRMEFEELFERFDVIAGPTSPTVAFKIGEFDDDPLSLKMADLLTIPANMLGTCAISVNCGFSEGLPVGLQIIGKPFDEETVLRAAFAYEHRTDWHTRRPPIA